MAESVRVSAVKRVLKISAGIAGRRGGGGGEGLGETRSGTEKQCSHDLQSGHPAW